MNYLPPFPVSMDYQECADWVELKSLLTNKKFNLGNLVSILETEDAPESLATDIWNELERRSVLIAADWPLVFTPTQIFPKKSSKTKDTYAFLAFLGLRWGVDYTSRRLFEELIEHTAKSLGATHSLRIGEPRTAPVPTDLTQAIQYYCDQSGEVFHNRNTPRPNGDRGADIVAWRNFADARGGVLHFIGQCATGGNWEEKLTELQQSFFQDYMSWAAPPVRFFATPIVVPKQRMRDATIRGGLIIDRPRIMKYCLAEDMKPVVDKLKDIAKNKLIGP